MVFLPLFLATLAGAPRILVHGHRGARAALPENTIPAFEHAIRVGADVLELDLAVTKDSVLVVSHDPVLDRAICSGPDGTTVIREMTLAELRRWDCGARKNPAFPKQKPVPVTSIPTLDEVLDLARLGNFEFNIETKSFPEHPEYTPPPEEFARLLLEAIRRHKLGNRVIVQSFDFRTLQALRRLAPAIRLAALFDRDGRDFQAIAREAGASIAAPNHRLVTREKVNSAHEAGVQVVPWTANTQADWDRLIEAGVDGIITDDPEELIRYLKTRGLR